MTEAARRLGWLGLVYCVAGFVAHFGSRALLALDSSTPIFRSADLFFVGAATLGLAVFVVSRLGLLSQKRLLDLGLVFQVTGALGNAGSRQWTPGLPSADFLFGLVPAECVWIVVYPLVVPTAPHKLVVASLLAASTGPAMYVASALLGGTAIERQGLLLFIANYLCAVVAYIISRIVYRFGMRLRQAREIGSYELIEKIGEGGMGEVWRAQHRLLARPAAIKLVRSDLLGSNERAREAMARRFEREAQDTATLRSVHTVDVYDFGLTEEGDFYYVMELLDGISLEQFVHTYGPMEPARAVYVLQQVCHSLGEAHGRSLVHRDIKPANILICRLGPDDDFVKVLDFGLVKHAGSGTKVTRLTMDGFAAGTPAYMPPEIALGSPTVDGRADIYALGCVAYYLVTGQVVFGGQTPVAVALAHVNDAPIPPRERSEFTIPAAFDSLILQCLAKDPADRPASPVELSNRLRATISHEAAWTAGAAHDWWELHRPHEQGTAKATSEAIAHRRRCWPRLDAKAANSQFT